MPRYEPLHLLLRRDLEAGKSRILSVVYQTGGNLRRASHLLGVSRYGLYLLLYRHVLWPEVNRIRREESRKEIRKNC